MNIKGIFILILWTLCTKTIIAQQFHPSFRGVWANAICELVQTDSVFLYFEKHISDGSSSSTLIVPSRKINMTATFYPDSTIKMKYGHTFNTKLGKDGNVIYVEKQKLQRIEKIETVQRYEMPSMRGMNELAERLQEWRLGVYLEFDPQTKEVHLTIGTNRHSFQYSIYNGMCYLRAAALQNCNKGSVFSQNIRLMKYPTSGEYTIFHVDDNVDFLQNLPLVDTTLFSPDFCILSPTQIYWYYKSHNFDLIELYGCKGDIYKIRRHSPNERFQLMEWIKYKKEETNYK